MPTSIQQSFFAVVVFNAALMAQQTGASSAPLSKQDVDSAVQQEEAAFAAAYNSADAKAVAALYTETASVLTEGGITLTGRADITKALNASFNIPDRKTKIENTPQNSTAVSKDVIVVQGTSRMTVTSDESSQPPTDFLYTRVLARRGQQWLIAAAEYARPNPWVVTLPPTRVGQTSSLKPITLTNIGGKPLRIRKVVLGGKGAPDFAQTNTCAEPVSPGSSCLLDLTFQPKVAGNRTARIWFVDDGATGIHEIRISGVGKAAPTDQDLLR